MQNFIKCLFKIRLFIVASCCFVASENALGQIKKHINTVAVVLEALTNIIIQTNCIPCKNITNKTTHTQTFNCILFELLIQGGLLSAHIHLSLMIPFVICVWHVLSKWKLYYLFFVQPRFVTASLQVYCRQIYLYQTPSSN